MSRSLSASIILSFCILATAGDHAFAQCEFGWSNPVHFDWPVHSLLPGVNFDEDGDGSMPSLYLFSGWLFNAGNIPVDGLAGWDGTYWHSFPGGQDIRWKVQAMATIDVDGHGPQLPVLYMGGSFESVGGVVAGKFARYSNGAWHGIADGVPSFPYGNMTKLITLDADGDGPSPPRLFALGTTLVELVGDTWQLVGENASTDFIERDVIVADEDGSGPLPISLVRSGYAGMSSSSEVDRWNGTEWQRLGGIFNGQTSALVMFDSDQGGPRDPELHVGGSFIQIGGQTIRMLARWRNSEWQALEGPQLSGSSIQRLAVGDDDGDGPRRNSLFVSGSFSVPGASGNSAIGLGRWDGQSWEGLGIPPVSLNTSMATLDYNGQRISRWFGSVGSDYYYHDSIGWRQYYQATVGTDVAVGTFDLDGPGPDGNVIVAAGRYLKPINGGVSKCVATWDGRNWARLGTNDPVSPNFRSMMLFDFDGSGPGEPSLILAGGFTLGGSHYVATALIGNLWTPLGPSMSGTASALAAFDDDGSGPMPPTLFIGGSFPGMGPNSTTAYLLRWTPGVGFTAVPAALDRAVTAMVVHDEDGSGPGRSALFVAGPMQIDALAVNGIGRWDGSQWTALVNATTGNVETPNPVVALCSLPGESDRFILCAAGSFNTPSGLRFAAQWKNGAWTAMGTSLGAELTKLVVDELGVDGTVARRLYGVGAGGLNKWNGHEWELLTPGSSRYRSMDTIDFDGSGPMAPQLVMGGWFTSILLSLSPTISELPAASIATWGSRQPFYFATPWDRSIAAGDRLSLKVATGGPEPMTFAWTRDGVTLSDGGAVSGATTRELIINPVGFGDSGQYECIATNACGSIPSAPTLVRVCTSLASGDLNADGHVDGLDISPFIAMWTSPPSPQSDCAVDLTHNGVRDPQDIDWFIGRLLNP